MGGIMDSEVITVCHLLHQGAMLQGSAVNDATLCVCCGEALVSYRLGGVSEEQCGGRAPLAMGVVMRRGGAVAGAGGGRFT